MDKLFVGRVYKLSSSEAYGVYIGSTKSLLRVRLNGHKSSYSKYNCDEHN